MFFATKQETGKANEGVQIKVAGPSFLPPFGKRPYVKPESQDQLDDVKRQETEISDKINPAIVEGTVSFISIPSLNTRFCSKARNMCKIHSCNFMIPALLFYEVNDPLLQVCYKP